MDEKRLAEIEGYANVMRRLRKGVLETDMVPELTEEVRRLQALADEWERGHRVPSGD